MNQQEQSQTGRKFPKNFNDYADEVLYVLMNEGETEGRELRKRLNKGKWFWQRWSGPSFYALMASLEDAGIICYKTKQKIIAGSDNVIEGVVDARFYSPAPIDNVAGYPVQFYTSNGKSKKGRVAYQEGHKLYINWTNPNGVLCQCIRFAHEVQLIEGK